MERGRLKKHEKVLSRFNYYWKEPEEVSGWSGMRGKTALQQAGGEMEKQKN